METTRNKLTIKRPWGHDQFLSKLVNQHVTITVNEAMYTGYLVSFDRYTLLIKTNTDLEALIFKSAIESIARSAA